MCLLAQALTFLSSMMNLSSHSSLAAILRMNGFSARFFTCPLEALAAARRSSESPRTSKEAITCRDD
jgi:hypothetical protein